MREPRNHLPRDLQGLRYLDALDAGDLEAVAALWEEASRDPELERMLAELDGALLAEHAGANEQADAERVRGPRAKHLPGRRPPSQPAAMRRRWAVGISLAGAVVAACLLVVLAWLGRNGKSPVPSPERNESAHQVSPPLSDDSARLAQALKACRDLNERDMPAFAWPLPEKLPMKLSTSLSPDRFD
jgi:hypothetical protein